MPGDGHEAVHQADDGENREGKRELDALRQQNQRYRIDNAAHQHEPTLASGMAEGEETDEGQHRAERRRGEQPAKALWTDVENFAAEHRDDHRVDLDDPDHDLE